MSRPGRIVQLPSRGYPGAPAGFSCHVLSVLKTLCDHRVSFHVGNGPAREEWTAYLQVNLSTPLRSADQADYVLLDGGAWDEAFFRVKRGSLDFPEDSATLVLSVSGVRAEDEAPGKDETLMALSGPGVRRRVLLGVRSLDPRYPAARADVNSHFPLGVDWILVDAEGRAAGIPRTTTVEVL